MKRVGALTVLLTLTMVFAQRFGDSGQVRFESAGQVKTLIEIPTVSIKLERFRGSGLLLQG